MANFFTNTFDRTSFSLPVCIAGIGPSYCNHTCFRRPAGVVSIPSCDVECRDNGAPDHHAGVGVAQQTTAAMGGKHCHRGCAICDHSDCPRFRRHLDAPRLSVWRMDCPVSLPRTFFAPHSECFFVVAKTVSASRLSIAPMGMVHCPYENNFL